MEKNTHKGRSALIYLIILLTVSCPKWAFATIVQDNCNSLLGLVFGEKANKFARAQERRVRQNKSIKFNTTPFRSEVSAEQILNQLISELSTNDFDKETKTLYVNGENREIIKKELWPLTVEVIFQHDKKNADSHLYLRVGEQVFSYWPMRGLKADSIEYVLENLPKRLILEGVILQLTEEEYYSLYDYFENSKRGNQGFSLLTNNCTTVVCEALSVSGFRVPVWPLSNMPNKTFSYFHNSKRFLVKTLYAKESN